MGIYLLPYIKKLKREIRDRYCNTCPKCGYDFTVDNDKRHIQVKRVYGTTTEILFKRKARKHEPIHIWKKYRIICLNCWHVWKSPIFPLTADILHDTNTLEKYYFDKYGISYDGEFIDERFYL